MCREISILDELAEEDKINTRKSRKTLRKFEIKEIKVIPEITEILNNN